VGGIKSLHLFDNSTFDTRTAIYGIINQDINFYVSTFLLSVACRKRPPPPPALHYNALKGTSEPLQALLITLSMI
jgi:hypothetical protein